LLALWGTVLKQDSNCLILSHLAKELNAAEIAKVKELSYALPQL